PAHPDIYTLSLHDALPISKRIGSRNPAVPKVAPSLVNSPCSRRGGQPLNVKSKLALPWRLRSAATPGRNARYQARKSARPSHAEDRKSTRLNSSHGSISYA